MTKSLASGAPAAGSLQLLNYRPRSVLLSKRSLDGYHAIH